MTAREPLLLIRDLLIQRGQFSLEVPWLKVERGEILALVGPNGSGKTTLLMSMGLLVRPQGGEILLCGQPTNGLSSPLKLRRKVAMVFQEPLLLKGTVMENVSMPLRLRGVRGQEAEKKALQVMERFRIAHLGTRDVRGLSGGEAQRVNLARALAVGPELLLLDEPLSSLDPPTRDELLEDLGALLNTMGTTVVMSTHDRLDGMWLSNRIAIIHQGRILQIGSPGELIREPKHPFVAEFLNLEKTKRILQGLLSQDA